MSTVNLPVLADDDPVCVSVNLDGAAGGMSHHRVFVGVEMHQAGLGDRCRLGVEAVERTDIGDQVRSLGFKALPHRAVPPLRMRVCHWAPGMRIGGYVLS